MSLTLTERERAFAINLGGQIARRAFAARGNHSEIHVEEIELGTMIRAAVEIAISEIERFRGDRTALTEAAPDLLSACEAALRFVNAHDGSIGDLATTLRDAVSKARGR
jgi:hypothetical protein